MAEVAAVYDVSRERAEQAAQVFGGPRVCSSLEELCQSDVDCVDVITPEAMHLEPVLAALAAHKHVFVEKPMATDLDHCAQMILAAESSGLFLMVGQILRFETRFAMLKQEISSGRLGKIASMHARRNRPRFLLDVYGRVHPAMENCIHDIDAMLWYTGERVRKVRGFGRKVTGGRHDDTFWGVLEFSGGAIGVVETIWLLPKNGGVALDDAFQVVGNRGVGNICFFPGSLSFWREDGFQIPDASYDPRLRGAAHGALREELAYFCECVLCNRTPQIITPREAKNAVRVVLALAESSAAGRDVEITEWD
jgi:predicted dehydrogenase